MESTVCSPLARRSGEQLPIAPARIAAVHDTRDETELLCHVVSVSANVVSAGCGVLPYELAEIASFGKDVGGMPELGHFGDDRAR